jgi:pimeloyl-ACP methyl ester carboxylesterase
LPARRSAKSGQSRFLADANTGHWRMRTPAGAKETWRATCTVPAQQFSRKDSPDRLPDDDERSTAGRRLRPDGLPRRARGIHARARRVRELDVRQESESVATRDEVLDDFSLYWLTNTAVSAARLYWENSNENLISAAAQKTGQISVPVAITVFPDDDLYRAPETWARRAFPSLSYFHQAARGGHFAGWEEPQLFSDEVRAAFRSLR